MNFWFDFMEIIVWDLFPMKIKKKNQKFSRYRRVILIIVIAAVIHMRTQSTTTCSWGPEGICVTYFCTIPSPLLCFGWKLLKVWFLSKATVTAPWGQPALRKQNINCDVQKMCVQEVKRKVECRRKTEFHS